MNHKILCKSCKWEKIYTGIPTTECNEYVKVKKTNMEKVAKMLGVEIGEEFRVDMKINDIHMFHFYRLQENGLFRDDEARSSDILSNLLSKKLGVVKIPQEPPNPWKPKIGEKYFYVSQDGICKVLFWNGFVNDYYKYNAGNCFKTQEEITPKIIKKIIKEMKGNYES